MKVKFVIFSKLFALLLIMPILLSPLEAKKKAKKKACKAYKWNLKAKDSTGKSYSLYSFREPVLTAFYEGKNTTEINTPVKDALKADKDLKDTGKYAHMYKGFGIANYQETWVPNWVIAKIIKGKIKKYKSVIWDDRDNCFSGKGKSDDCVGGKRRQIFRNKKPGAAVFYNKYKVKILIGKIPTARFLKYIKGLTDAAKKKKDICWVLKNVKY